ncbi:MAG: hypothetical protein ACK4GD_12785 [Sphingomonadaceae bacterium]
MELSERAQEAVGQGLVFEDSVSIQLRSPGDNGPHAYRIEMSSVTQYIVASQGEQDFDLVSLTRRDGLVRVKLWPISDYVHYVECEVRPNPDGTLIWGARMGDAPAVYDQRATRTIVDGKPIQYFTLPYFPGSPNGSADFWFTMQDNVDGNWNLVDRISLVLFRRS